jgi:hypothetical protein
MRRACARATNNHEYALLCTRLVGNEPAGTDRRGREGDQQDERQHAEPPPRQERERNRQRGGDDHEDEPERVGRPRTPSAAQARSTVETRTRAASTTHSSRRVTRLTRSDLDRNAPTNDMPATP